MRIFFMAALTCILWTHGASAFTITDCRSVTSCPDGMTMTCEVRDGCPGTVCSCTIKALAKCSDVTDPCPSNCTTSNGYVTCSSYSCVDGDLGYSCETTNTTYSCAMGYYGNPTSATSGCRRARLLHLITAQPAPKAVL